MISLNRNLTFNSSEKVLRHEDLKGAPVLLFANKQVKFFFQFPEISCELFICMFLFRPPQHNLRVKLLNKCVP
jgi:hypothetical protein